jgi:DNA-binding transcriptional LysR family regulator
MHTLSYIETFVQIVDGGSLAAAARELSISSAAVSKQLKRLEAELGLQLLERSTRKMRLTEVGAHYYEQCKRILEEVASAAALASQMKTSPQGHLKVTCGRYFAAAYLIPHLKEFLFAYPEIELHLELAERIPDFEAEGVDLVIGMSLSATGNVIQKKIGTTRYTLCASPAYLEKWGVPHLPADLVRHRYITHSQRRPDDLVTFANGEEVRLKPYLRVNEGGTMANLAALGIGIVRLHDYVVARLIQQGKLLEILADFPSSELPLYVAFPERRYLPAKVRAFIDFFVPYIHADSVL